MLALTPAQVIDLDAAFVAIQGAVNANVNEWWTLEFSPLAETLFSTTVFPALAAFAVAAGDTIEGEAYYHKLTGANGGLFISADAATGYFFGNLSTGADVLTVIGGGSPNYTNASSTYTGLHHGKFTFNVVATNSVYMYGGNDSSNTGAAVHDSTVDIVGASVLLYLETDNIAKCAARWRKVTAAVFPA